MHCSAAAAAAGCSIYGYSRKEAPQQTAADSSSSSDSRAAEREARTQLHEIKDFLPTCQLTPPPMEESSENEAGEGSNEENKDFVNGGEDRDEGEDEKSDVGQQKVSIAATSHERNAVSSIYNFL